MQCMRKTYRIKVSDEHGNVIDKEVQGYPAIIEGYEDFEFCVHRALPYYDGWTVSEVSSGFNIFPPSWSGSHSNKTRAGAIAIATERLNRYGRGYFLDCMMRIDAKHKEGKP